MAQIDFGGVIETVVTREEFPLSKAREVLKNEVVAVIGYGVQGPAQALNMKDNGINVIIGQAPEFRNDWDRAVADGFVPGTTLFPVEEAAARGTVIQYLVSDAAQRLLWPQLKPHLTAGKALYFSHGFLGDLQGAHRGFVPPKDIDVILCAPKGSGTSVRRKFSGRRRDQLKLLRLPGFHRQGRREGHCPGHRHRLGIPLPHHI